MSTKCTVCADERRPEIDVALQGGWPLRMIAKHFPGISKDVAGRHKKHISEAATKELPPPERTSDSSQALVPSEATEPQCPRPLTVTRPEHANVIEGDDQLMAEAERIRQTAWALLAKADDMGEGRTAVAALREVRGVAETRAKLECRPGFVVRDATEGVQICITLAGLTDVPELPAAVEITATR